MKRITRFIIAIILIFSFLGTASIAAAVNITFRRPNNTAVTYSSTYRNNWVGYGERNQKIYVRIVQAANNTLPGQLPLIIDGLHGPKTDTEIRVFQVRQGLSSDGTVGTNTWGRYHTLRGCSSGHRINF